MRRASGVAIALAVGVLFLTAGCTSIPSAGSGCAEAFEALPELDPVDGVYIIVSEQLAGTISQCSDVDAWLDELRRNPSVAGVQEIDESVIYAYLAGACGLLPDDGNGDKLCDEGRQLGYFD